MNTMLTVELFAVYISAIDIGRQCGSTQLRTQYIRSRETLAFVRRGTVVQGVIVNRTKVEH